jgi:hypothetical protein
MSVISGRVIDEDGEPVLNLDVAALKLEYHSGKREWTRVGGAKTSDQGEYRIPMLAAGRYLVRTAERESPLVSRSQSLDRPLPQAPESIYPATHYPSAADEARATSVQVGIGAEVRGIDFRLTPAKAFRIRGRIAKPAGVGAILVLTAKETGTRLDMVHLPAAENRFELRGVVPGAYVIDVEPEDSDLKALGRQAVEITDHHVDGLVIGMAPANDIPGVVKVEAAEALPDLHQLSIALRGRAIYFLPETNVGPDLKFVLKDIVPTRFEVLVSGVPDNCYVKAIRYGGEEISNVGAECVNGSKLEIILSATAAQINGSVTDKDGQPVVGATVALIPKDGAPLAVSGSSDAAGRFRFAGLKPGEYRLLAWDEIEPGAFMDPEFVKQFESGAEAVTLAASGRQSVELKVIRVP